AAARTAPFAPSHRARRATQDFACGSPRPSRTECPRRRGVRALRNCPAALTLLFPLRTAPGEAVYFLALATDYDGTLAHDGVVDAETVAALRRLKNSGRRLILVSGRELPDLKRAFPEFAVCDLIVVENGAVLYEP